MDKKSDRTPESFGSYAEAAEFWNAHLDEFRTVEVKSELRNRYFEVEENL